MPTKRPFVRLLATTSPNLRQATTGIKSTPRSPLPLYGLSTATTKLETATPSCVYLSLGSAVSLPIKQIRFTSLPPHTHMACKSARSACLPPWPSCIQAWTERHTSTALRYGTHHTHRPADGTIATSPETEVLPQCACRTEAL